MMMNTRQIEYTFTERWGYRVSPKGTVIVTVFDSPPGDPNDHAIAGTFVILTEPHNNPGGSVTNFCEEIATQLVADLGLNVATTWWIEHYPASSHPYMTGSITRNESFDFLTFHWEKRPSGQKACDVQWKRTSREVVEAMIGQAFDAPAMLVEVEA
jgi:hypothetical protein